MIRNPSNLDTEMGPGFFLTDVKQASKTKQSQEKLPRESPAARNESESNMVSFGFLTRVPISDFIDLANKDAQKSVSKHKQRLEKTIIQQLDRTLEDLKQERKMAKVRASLKQIKEAYKTDENHKKHAERIQSIKDYKVAQTKREKKRAQEYLEKMKVDDEARTERMKTQLQLRLETIAEATKKQSLKLKSVAEHHKRLQSEEAAKVTERMSEINARLESHSVRARDVLTQRKLSMERSTSKVFSTLASARSRVDEEIT